MFFFRRNKKNTSAASASATQSTASGMGGASSSAPDAAGGGYRPSEPLFSAYQQQQQFYPGGTGHDDVNEIMHQSDDEDDDLEAAVGYGGYRMVPLASQLQLVDGGAPDHQNSAGLHWYTLMHDALEEVRRMMKSTPQPDSSNTAAAKAEENRLYQRLSTVCSDFTEQATVYARLIVSELAVPDHLKSIKPVAKGVAGGQKFFVGGILLKVSRDTQPIPQQGFLYGGRTGPDHELAGKAASNDMRGANTAFALTFSPLDDPLDVNAVHVPLQCLIDYRGFRVVAMPVLPISNETLHYGADNAGSQCTVKASGPAVRVMERLGEKLHLAKHTVSSSSGTKELVTAVDVECHFVPSAAPQASASLSSSGQHDIDEDDDDQDDAGDDDDTDDVDVASQFAVLCSSDELTHPLFSKTLPTLPTPRRARAQQLFASWGYTTSSPSSLGASHPQPPSPRVHIVQYLTSRPLKRTRALLVDLARLCPPEAPLPDAAVQATLRHPSSHWLHQLLRPEFLLRCRKEKQKEENREKDQRATVSLDVPPLSADALSPFATDEDGMVTQHEKNLRQATSAVYNVLIAEVALVLSAAGTTTGTVDISSELHSRGLCVRHLGAVRANVTQPEVRIRLLSNMVSRVLKNLLRKGMRDLIDGWSGYRTTSADAHANGSDAQASVPAEAVTVAAPALAEEAAAAREEADVTTTAQAAATRDIAPASPAVSSPIVPDRHTREYVCSVLNRFVGSQQYWFDEIIPGLYERFGKGALPLSADVWAEVQDQASLRRVLQQLPPTIRKSILQERVSILHKTAELRIIQHACEACGIELTPMCQQELHRVTEQLLTLRQFRFFYTDVSFVPRVKYMACVDYFHGRALLHACKAPKNQRNLMLQGRLAASAHKHLLHYIQRRIVPLEQWEAAMYLLEAERTATRYDSTDSSCGAYYGDGYAAAHHYGHRRGYGAGAGVGAGAGTAADAQKRGAFTARPEPRQQRQPAQMQNQNQRLPHFSAAPDLNPQQQWQERERARVFADYQQAPATAPFDSTVGGDGGAGSGRAAAPQAFRTEAIAQSQHAGGFGGFGSGDGAVPSKCESCVTNPPSVQCIECDDYLCWTCDRIMHRADLITAKHQRTPISNSDNYNDNSSNSGSRDNAGKDVGGYAGSGGDGFGMARSQSPKSSMTRNRPRSPRYGYNYNSSSDNYPQASVGGGGSYGQQQHQRRWPEEEEQQQPQQERFQPFRKHTRGQGHFHAAVPNDASLPQASAQSLWGNEPSNLRGAQAPPYSSHRPEHNASAAGVASAFGVRNGGTRLQSRLGSPDRWSCGLCYMQFDSSIALSQHTHREHSFSAPSLSDASQTRNMARGLPAHTWRQPQPQPQPQPQMRGAFTDTRPHHYHYPHAQDYASLPQPSGAGLWGRREGGGGPGPGARRIDFRRRPQHHSSYGVAPYVNAYEQQQPQPWIETPVASYAGAYSGAGMYRPGPDQHSFHPPPPHHQQSS